MDPNLSVKSGESSESGMFASNLCAKSSTASLKANEGQLENYKCPLCNEIFSMPGALKQHFRIHNGKHELKGPFPCTVQACQFSSTVRQEFLAHLTSKHCVTLVPCTFHSCKLAFCTQGEMESHWRNHMPFHCHRCHFVTPHAKQLRDHYFEHNCPHIVPQGEDVLTTTTGLDGGSQPVNSGRPKRKRKPNPAYVSSSSQGDEKEPEDQGPNTKRLTKDVAKENNSQVTYGTDARPSKGEDVLTTTTGLDGGSQPVNSGRPKRKRKPNPAYVSSSSQGDEKEPENQGPNTKRLTKEVAKGKNSQVIDGTDVRPSKGEDVLTTTTGLDGGSQPVNSGRPKRKRKPNPAYVSSSSQGDEKEPEDQGPNTKRSTKEVAKEKHSQVNDGTDARPSKDYLVEGTEHIYRTHTCPECRRCFKMRSHLQEHLLLHFPDPNLQCLNCKRYFTSKSKLRIHMLREAGEKVHRCHLCEYSAVERNSLHRHLASVHADDAGGDTSSQVYPCPTCGQRFGQSRSLKAHMKTHNVPQDRKSVHCFQEGCSYQSSSRPALLRHATKAHGVTAVKCRHHACNAVFRDEKDMEDHRKTHLAYHCSQCDFSCSNKTIFLQHQRQGHSGDQELCCDFCSFVTFNPVEFEQHVGHLHASEKIHRCPQCSYVTSHKRGLRRHMLMHSGEKPHKCSRCDFRCRDESYLSKHMLTHSDHKNFMCSECGYITKWKHYLNVHMRKHAGDLRYQCDQCPYRCHRTDQLNSHKLRHQAKTLICEVCGYVCKRKYELRKHMLVKHSGEGQQPTAYQCEYCTYTTFHRQALQNHENCKHTKLKEFRCALCFYSSFSSISLFLHKRKVHGYVPGDKAWLENYAAKEREKNSIDFMQDFYKNPSTTREQSEQSTKGAPPPPSSERQREQSDLKDSVDPNANQEPLPAPGIETLDMANFDIAPQDVADQSISVNAPSVNSPEEEYCTLVLTTLSNAEYNETTSSLSNTEYNETTLMQSEPENRTPSLNCEGSVTPQEKTDITASISEAEEDNGPMEDGDYDQSDLEENDGPLNSLCQPAELAETEPQTAEVTGAVGIISSSSPSGQNQHLESEVRLKAMKKHDKDQAEAMVLEGRVHMLVVQSQDVYSCDKCSYVTRKETALNHHSQSLCHGRLKGHKCQACGAQFKQRRGLDSHLLKKCPARQQNTRTFVGLSAACLTAENDSALTVQGQDRSNQLDTRITTDEPELPPLDNVLARDSEDKQSDERGEEACTSDLTNCKGHVEKASVSGKSKSQQKDIAQMKKHLKVNFVKKPKLSSNKDRGEERTLVISKFTCKLCNFSTNRLATSKRHSSTCRKKASQNRLELDEDRNEILSGGEEWVEEENESTNKGSGHKFSCASCPFKCNQKRALDNHEKAGCMKPGEIQCQLCSFVAKSQFSLTNHFSFVHEKSKSGVTKPRRLQCEHCTFTCKQERCMVQHVAFKHKGTRPHCCRYCPFSTTRRHRLEEHESLHTGVGRHSCDKCAKTFGTITKLRQHKTRVHDRQPSHFCSLCDFSGYTLDDIKRHNLRCHTGELQHPCTHCKSRFSSDVALRNHCKRLHQLEDCFSCTQCVYICGSETTLKTHQQSKHPPLKCTTCQESFDTKEILKMHRRTHFAQRCHLCPFATKLKHVLAQHLLDEHEGGSTEDKPLKCSSCEFACRHQLVLEQHLRSHGGKRLYKCTDCEYSTRNKQKITWHIRIHTGEKPYSCEQCSYTCTDPERLKYHMRVHQEERKYLCPECGYKCKWMTQLKYHMTRHTGEKPFACEECDYRTNRADALRVHRDTQHRDVRPYICEKCGKCFKTRFLLKTHQRQHSDDRPYVCGLCHKAFRWPASLRHHYLSHTKQNPYHCRHCSYKAIQKFQVVKHLQRHHPEVPVEQGVMRDSGSISVTLKEALAGTLGERATEVEEEGQGGAEGKAREVGGEMEEAVRRTTESWGENRE